MTGNDEPQLAPGEQVRVLTWNVQHAAAPRTHQQARWLATADPHDVLVLTEVAAGETGRLLARLLGEFGYTVHLPEAGDDNYRVLLACRSPILDVVSETGVDFLPHRCVAARVRVLGIDVGVIGLYVPSRGPKDQRNVAKRGFQEAVTAALPGMSARLNVAGPVVITGDLNVVEPGHDPRYPVFGSWEYDFYRAFSKAGFLDAFRITHPTGMDYSWFGRPCGDGGRNGYRFDHTFITAAHATAVHDCRYLHHSRENGLSDHSPMTLTARSGAASSASPPAGRGHRDPTHTSPNSHHDRILAVVRRLGGDIDTCNGTIHPIPATEPTRLRTALSTVLPDQVIFTGTLERRLLLAQHAEPDQWTVADLAGQVHRTRAWPSWVPTAIQLDDESNWISRARISRARISLAGVHRLTHPKVLLAALYHPEHFPLPRFPLAISDLARAARSTLTGQVQLMDMQLGVTLDDITATIREHRPDILGVSATFGQHDLLTDLLDMAAELTERPLVLVGGSLPARNERLLLRRYPWLLIARGAGEPTIADVLAHWHGDIELSQVRGIGYSGAPRSTDTLVISRYRKTATVANRAQTDIFPELDLLAATFDHRGVAQLESSRGCTNFCSFCPRGHKGTWSGTSPDALGWIVRAISEVFDRYAEVSRTFYLVDEEFIGRGPDAVPRALAVADVLNTAGLRWETSCRIDRVVRPDADRVWHRDRAHLWRQLCARGLRRCLFGVESGVDSILARFNKETTSSQNALAIRTLSALGVPTRFTYITFDHLMTPAELLATYAFQARWDLLLRPLPHLSVKEIVGGVRDEDFVAEHAAGQPFYTGISYLLVSMECLIGAAYIHQVQAAGLGGTTRPAMGRLDAEFADWRIGRFSHHAQLWVDRNFALDYTLKSLEKLLDGRPRDAVRAARVVLKDAAFALLHTMVTLLDRYPPDQPDPDDLDRTLTAHMDAHLTQLRAGMAKVVHEVGSVVPGKDAKLLFGEYTRWATTDSWGLINAADPCGT